MTAPADWYPSPYEGEVGLLRYWDGTSWTSHTHDPAAVQASDRPSDEAPVVTEPSLEQPVDDSTKDDALEEDQDAFDAAHGAPSNSDQGSLAAVATGVNSDTSGEHGVVGHVPTAFGHIPTVDRKITAFNAKKIAQALADEVNALRSRLAQQDQVLAEYGIADVAERVRRADDLFSRVAGLQRELSELDNQLRVARQGLVDAGEQATLEEAGLFRYVHPAQTSAQLQGQLEALRDQIKAMVKSKSAVRATSAFTFNNSAAQGAKFVRNMSTIMLRAYNAEAENGIKSTKAGNLAAAQKRLGMVKDQIAKQGSMIDLKIDDRYHGLRLKEQELAAAHLQRLAEERDMERERKAELREQKRVEAEMKAEKDRLEKERNHYLNSIAALASKGDTEGMARLQEKLADVDRAIEDVDYRAANIRAGYVYVISNVGSLGEGTVKIGMTRRLEPMDRVKELGDASVPFTFDVHALFFSDDAVGVEAMLHRTFAEERVNKVNLRREFFRVKPEQVLEVLKAHDVEVLEFDVEAAADEFRTSWPGGLESVPSQASAMPVLG